MGNARWFLLEDKWHVEKNSGGSGWMQESIVADLHES
jgi:hypothetical protein